MSDNIHYLSDEELNRLIADVEDEGLYEAPADLEDKVVYTLIERQKKKTISFATYCLRVGFGVAAAILLLIMVPTIPTFIATDNTSHQERHIPSKEEVLGNRQTPTKEEVISTMGKSHFEEAKEYFDNYLSDLFE